MSSHMGTFYNWPQHARLSPEQLAAAGFFYTSMYWEGLGSCPTIGPIAIERAMGGGDYLPPPEKMEHQPLLVDTR